jgi:ABC-type siderophore export system fused ATPase/permease subunit
MHSKLPKILSEEVESAGTYRHDYRELFTHAISDFHFFYNLYAYYPCS